MPLPHTNIFYGASYLFEKYNFPRLTNSNMYLNVIFVLYNVFHIIVKSMILFEVFFGISFLNSKVFIKRAALFNVGLSILIYCNTFYSIIEQKKKKNNKSFSIIHVNHCTRVKNIVARNPYNDFQKPTVIYICLY